MTETLFLIVPGAILTAAPLIKGLVVVASYMMRRIKVSREHNLALRAFQDRLKELETNPSSKRSENNDTPLLLEVVRREIETPDQSVCSFYLQCPEGKRLPSFEPGQFLTVDIPLQNMRSGNKRCYSLSEAPYFSQFMYRLTVKRNSASQLLNRSSKIGSGSAYLHDTIKVGDRLRATKPAGSFVLRNNSNRPVVLVAGGVGLTPILSMLNELIQQNSRREIWLFYGVRNRNDHLMYNHLQRIRNNLSHINIKIFYSQPTRNCRQGYDFDYPGHVSVLAMSKMLKSDNYEFYLCGPPSMIDNISADLNYWGVSERDVFKELFVSPSTQDIRIPELKRQKYFNIKFKRSAVDVRWTHQNGSLLEFAEACGIRARYGCRAGQCGSCHTNLEKGEVAYSVSPRPSCGDRAFLPCVAYPASDLVIDM